jgi:tripartite-type tricarboxylate transporter receptor subunit TctC
MRTLSRLLALSVLLLAPHFAQAQAWPTKPIKLISPYTPGGTNDITARLVAKFMQERLGQPVLVENKPGANNRLATELVARAPADGYTLF